MREPHRRKLFWVASGGFTFPEYPDDDAIFRAEEAAGLLSDTNIEDSEDEDDLEDLQQPGSLYSIFVLNNG